VVRTRRSRGSTWGRVGTLKHHPDPLPKLDEIDAVLIDILAVELDHSVNVGGSDTVVHHPIETPEERRLSTARRADERRHTLFRDVYRDTLQRMVVAVVNVEVLDGEFRLAAGLVVCPLGTCLLDGLAGGRGDLLAVGAVRRRLCGVSV